MKNGSNEKVSQLRCIQDEIDIHVQGLKSLGMSEEKRESLLVSIMSVMSRENFDKFETLLSSLENRTYWKIVSIHNKLSILWRKISLQVHMLEYQNRKIERRARTKSNGNCLHDWKGCRFAVIYKR